MDRITEYVISLIRECLKNELPERTYPDILRKSASHYAAEAIISRMKEDDRPPLIVLEGFSDDMKKFAGYNPKTSVIFLTCKETADFFIRLLI